MGKRGVGLQNDDLEMGVGRKSADGGDLVGKDGRRKFDIDNKDNRGNVIKGGDLGMGMNRPEREIPGQEPAKKDDGSDFKPERAPTADKNIFKRMFGAAEKDAQNGSRHKELSGGVFDEALKAYVYPCKKTETKGRSWSSMGMKTSTETEGKTDTKGDCHREFLSLKGDFTGGANGVVSKGNSSIISTGAVEYAESSLTGKCSSVCDAD